MVEKYLEDWRGNSGWDLNAFIKRVNRECGCEVKYHNYYNAKRIAMRMIYGDANEEYSRVRDYAEAIRKFIPSSATIVKCIGIESPLLYFKGCKFV